MPLPIGFDISFCVFVIKYSYFHFYNLRFPKKSENVNQWLRSTVNHFWYYIKESETYAEYMVNILLLSAIQKLV